MALEPDHVGDSFGPKSTTRRWSKAIGVYRDRRMVIILLLGFSSGLPFLLLSLSIVPYWLAKGGDIITAVRLLVLVSLVYTLQIVWAPVVDHVNLPVLTRTFGRRRGWALASQVGLIAAILAMGATDPSATPWATAIFALFVAFFSASQDVVIEAYRIEILRDDEQGAGASMINIGYRVGLLVVGTGAISLSDLVGWFWVFAVMSALMLVGVVTVLLCPEPAIKRKAPVGISRFRYAIVAPLKDLMSRRGWLVILGFILFYVFGNAIGREMAVPFYVELGFSKKEIGFIVGFYGLFATMAGYLFGGVVVARYGILKALLIGAVLQVATNLLFAAQAVVGHDLPMLRVTLWSDNFTGGMASVALIAYVSSLCDSRFTATQYPLLGLIMSLGRSLLSASNGWLADHLEWVSFFVATSAFVLPGLLMLVWVMRLARDDPGQVNAVG